MPSNKSNAQRNISASEEPQRQNNLHASAGFLGNETKGTCAEFGKDADEELALAIQRECGWEYTARDLIELQRELMGLQENEHEQWAREYERQARADHYSEIG